MACTISPTVQVTAMTAFAAPRHSTAIVAMVSDLKTPLTISRFFRAIRLVPWSSPFVFMGKHLDVFRQPLVDFHRVITTHAKLIYFIGAHAIACSSRRQPPEPGKNSPTLGPKGPSSSLRFGGILLTRS